MSALLGPPSDAEWFRLFCARPLRLRLTDSVPVKSAVWTGADMAAWLTKYLPHREQE